MISLRTRWNRLQSDLKNKRRVLIAYSGGCDSAFLLAAARKILGRENILGVTAVSASLAETEKENARTFAATQDAPHFFIETNEMSNPSYVSNPSNRCFFCKNELYSKLVPLAQSRGMTLVDGMNLSDRKEYRPGAKAASDHGVSHPLVEANLEKRDIRALSRWMRLSTWNKPAMPCLSSRIPYGTAVTFESLRKIENAEYVLKNEGFLISRVRHFGKLARIEVPLAKNHELVQKNVWERVCSAFHRIGYENVELDPRGFQSGRLNESLEFPSGKSS